MTQVKSVVWGPSTMQGPTQPHLIAHWLRAGSESIRNGVESGGFHFEKEHILSLCFSISVFLLRASLLSTDRFVSVSPSSHTLSLPSPPPPRSHLPSPLPPPFILFFFFLFGILVHKQLLPWLRTCMSSWRRCLRHQSLQSRLGIAAVMVGVGGGGGGGGNRCFIQ